MAVIDFRQMRNEEAFLQRSLKKFGLNTDINQAIAQMGRLVRDHKHFERLLTEAGPELRQELYDSLRPHLKFVAKPLDVYVADAGKMAEREQLPTIGPDGMLHEFQPARDARSIEADVEDMLASALAKRTLVVTCAKCTRQQTFFGVGDETPVAVVLKARKAGWIYDYKADPPVEICPACPTSLRADD